VNTINLHTYIPQTRTLGPFLRFALWVQACPFRCTNCMTPAAQTESGGTLVPISELADKIINTPSIEGLTITGGEPFAQSAALVQLIKQVRLTKDLGIIVYSGYTLKKLQVLPYAVELLQHIDLLIDGTYVAALNDGGSLRGSSNQQVHTFFIPSMLNFVKPRERLSCTRCLTCVTRLKKDLKLTRVIYHPVNNSLGLRCDQ